MTNWPVLTEHDAIFLWFSHHMLLLLFSWDFASQSEYQLLGPRWTLTSEKLSCWDHRTAFTGSHTKPLSCHVFLSALLSYSLFKGQFLKIRNWNSFCRLEKLDMVHQKILSFLLLFNSNSGSNKIKLLKTAMESESRFLRDSLGIGIRPRFDKS